MKVKIIKSSSNMYWYSNKVGQIFDVENEITFNNKYKVSYREGYTLHWIDVEDAELVKEDVEQMNVKEWLHNNVWFIRIKNKEQFNIIKEYLYQHDIEFLYEDDYQDGLSALGYDAEEYKVLRLLSWDDCTCYGDEIKFSFRTVVDKVEFPEVKSEQELKIEELENTIKQAQEQLQQLKELK